MNHKLWAGVAARVLAVSFVIGGLTACGEKLSDVSSSTAPNVPVSPSAQVIGTPPANPTGAEPPGTTPVASNTTEVTKREESMAKPQEGDNHSYSTLAKDSPQKASGSDPQGGEGRKSEEAKPAEPAKEGAPK